MQHYKAGMIQMLVEANHVQKNLELAKKLIKEARDRGCSIAILPECFDLGWANPDAFILASPIPGLVSNTLCDIARDNGLFIVAGITEKENEKVYNTAVLISDTGELLAKHRKINILTHVEGMYCVGNILSVTDTKLGKIGMSICADNSEGSTCIAHSLARMGAQVIFSPSSWAVPPGFDNEKTPYGDEWLRPYKQLSQLYDITIVAVSNVGPVTVGAWKGWNCIGNSIAMGPGGERLVVMPHGVDAMLVHVIEVNLIEAAARGTGLVDILAKRGYKTNN